MKIELRLITYNAALSQETSAYTADVYIDGELAFHARNQGTGGADFFHKVGRWTEMEVNQWLVANRPQQFFGKFTYDHDLEVEVGDLLARELERRRLKRRMRTFVVTIRAEEHTSELQSLLRISYAVFCLQKKTPTNTTYIHT